MTTSQLRLVVDLVDSRPQRFLDGCLYIDIAGRAWVLEPIGCAACLDEGWSQTLSHAGTPPGFLCTVCGELEALDYESIEEVQVRVGMVEWSDREVVKDEILIPKHWTNEERQMFFAGILADLENPDS